MVAFTKLITALAVTYATTVSAIPLEADSIEFLDDDISSSSSNTTAIDAAAAVRRGDLTYYTPGLGACGVVNGENDAIVAISHVIFDPKTPGGNPNNNPLCGRRIRIRRNGKSVVVRVQDRCEACKKNDLDVPVKVFKKLAKQSQGRVKMNWNYL